MEFDLQQYLRDMREENQDAIKTVRDENKGHYLALSNKIEGVVAKTNAHETRIVVVENMRTNVRWLTGTVIGSALAYAFSLFHSGGAK